MKIGIVCKPGSPEALDLASRVLKYIESKGVDAYLDSRLSESLRWDKLFELGRDRVDFVVVIGGDGTVLRTLHLLGDNVIPIITIRYGKRGFLCDVAPFEYKSVIDRLLEGRYKLVEYMRLSGEVKGRYKLNYVLNDYVITTAGAARAKVARVHVMKNDEPIYYLVGDGVIVSPPLGSTAYNLAAGGPVVDPEMHAIIVTPLAPITFCSRAVVLPPTTSVRVIVSKDSPQLVLIGDGAFTVELDKGDEVIIRKAPTNAVFARFFVRDFYVRLFERCM